MQAASANQSDADQFVIGDAVVRPTIDQTFTADQPLGVYPQLYNLKVDEKTHKNDTSIVAHASKAGQEMKTVAWTGEELQQNGDEITIQDADALKGLAPGQYHLEISATDRISKQTIARRTDFTIAPSMN